jgi:hypothetical protein
VSARNRPIDRIDVPHSAAFGVVVARAGYPLAYSVISLALRLTGGRRV